MAAPRVLLTQLRRIGDVLMTTPAVRALRQAWPEAELTFLTEAPCDQVYRHNPRLNALRVTPAHASAWGHVQALRALRGQHFDVVLDFFSNPRSAQLTWATGAPLRIGYDRPGRRWAYTRRVGLPLGLRYSVLDKLALLEPLGIPIPADGPGLLPEVFVLPGHRDYARRQLEELGVRPDDLLVALCPVSRQPYKLWPAEHFARIADILIERYAARVLLLWGPGEEGQVDQVRLRMTHVPLPGYAVPDLLQLAALLERCHLYVGNDNGPRHLAVAMGTPTVTVFGRPFPEHWTPPGANWHRTVAHDPGCKSACTYPECAHLNCINAVPYAPVQAQVESLLEELLKDGIPARG